MTRAVEQPIVKLQNPIQHYGWGSTRAIAELQGRPVPSPEPEAELWIGDHPIAPSVVQNNAGDEQPSIPLSAWIQPLRLISAGSCLSSSCRLRML
jgi:mannose-6-phosphate isomerase class I